MDDILNEIEQAILRCESAVKSFYSVELLNFRDRIRNSVVSADKAWSGSWFGYQSRVYIMDLAPKEPGEYFSIEYGSSGGRYVPASRGRWAEWSGDAVRERILNRASAEDWSKPQRDAHTAREIFDDVKRETLATLAVLLNPPDTDSTVQQKQLQISQLENRIHARIFLEAKSPQGSFAIRDARAREEGLQPPPHLLVEAELLELLSSGEQLQELADHLRYILKFLRVQYKVRRTGTSTKESNMGPKTRTASILFMDVSGWSKLNAHTIYEYVTKAMPDLAKEIRGHDFINTWGDAIVATFGSAKDAAESALRIKAFFTQGYAHGGVAEGLSCRISLHAGEVILCENPLRGGEDIFGDAVHMAARLEPATAPGHVFCTTAFAALLKSVSGIAPKAWLLPNKLLLPKGYGEIEASVVAWYNEADPRPGLSEFIDSKAIKASP